MKLGLKKVSLVEAEAEGKGRTGELGVRRMGTEERTWQSRC